MDVGEGAFWAEGTASAKALGCCGSWAWVETLHGVELAQHKASGEVRGGPGRQLWEICFDSPLGELSLPCSCW